MLQVTAQVPLVPLTIANCLLIILCLVIGALYLWRLRSLPGALAVNLGMRLSGANPQDAVHRHIIQRNGGESARNASLPPGG